MMFQESEDKSYRFQKKNQYIVFLRADMSDEICWIRTAFGGLTKKLLHYLGLISDSDSGQFGYFLRIIFQVLLILAGLFPLILISILKVKISPLCPSFCEESDLRSNIGYSSVYYLAIGIFIIMAPKDDSAIEDAWINLKTLDLASVHRPVSRSIWLNRPMFLMYTLCASLAERNLIQVAIVNWRDNNVQATIALGLFIGYQALVLLYFIEKIEELFGYILLTKHTQNLMIENLEKETDWNLTKIDEFRLLYKKFSTFNQACDIKWKWILFLAYPLLLLHSILQLYFIITRRDQTDHIVSLVFFMILNFTIFLRLSLVSIDVNSGADRISKVIQKSTMKNKDPIFIMQVRFSLMRWNLVLHFYLLEF